MARMKPEIASADMNLGQAQLLKLRGAKGVRLACRSGMLWVTQENVRRDDFLAAGATLIVETEGVVVVEALELSRLGVEAGARAGCMPPAARPRMA
jgi:hypothetical protein